MVALVLALLMLSMTGYASCTWCVCKDMSDAVLQKTLDYACGAGADCNPIHQNAPCFTPNSVRAHCSYAVNSYFQKKGQTSGSCDFAGTATLATSDPSTAGCSYPATASSGGTSTTSNTPVTGTPSTGTPSTGTPTTTNIPITTNTPTTATTYNNTTSSNGVPGGIGSGTNPTTTGINNDYSDEGFRLQAINLPSFFTTLLLSSLLLLLN